MAELAQMIAADRPEPGAAFARLVSAKSARMCERAVLTNRPSLDLSPFRA
jgi:hypothetical protein